MWMKVLLRAQRRLNRWGVAMGTQTPPYGVGEKKLSGRKEHLYRNGGYEENERRRCGHGRYSYGGSRKQSIGPRSSIRRYRSESARRKK